MAASRNRRHARDSFVFDLWYLILPSLWKFRGLQAPIAESNSARPPAQLRQPKSPRFELVRIERQILQTLSSIPQHRNDNFAPGMPFLIMPDGCGDIAQRVAAIDDRYNLAFFKKLSQKGKVLLARTVG